MIALLAALAFAPTDGGLEEVRRLYVGRRVWNMGRLGPSEIPPGTRLRVVSARPARAERMRLGATSLPDDPEFDAVAPVALTLRTPRGEAFPCIVMNLRHASLLLSLTPPPASLLRKGRVLDAPQGGMTPDEAAWCWGWPPNLLTRAEFCRRDRWEWGMGRISKHVVFEAGRVVEVAGVPQGPSI